MIVFGMERYFDILFQMDVGIVFGMCESFVFLQDIGKVDVDILFIVVGLYVVFNFVCNIN